MTFLSKQEMETLTGYKQPKRQLELLALRGIPFTLDAYGRPVVSVGAVNAPPPQPLGYDAQALAVVLAGERL